MWVVLDGIDRSGKTTVANYFKSIGYKYIHMSAPDKKYTQSGYSGPSYLDDMVEMMISLSNQDVVFDRSIVGELVWPYVYGREPLLSEEDIDVLREIEESQGVRRILMIDPDKNAHWKRCVDNKEPLTSTQFNHANVLFSRMAHKYGFEIRELKDFADVITQEKAKDNKPVSTPDKQECPKEEGQSIPIMVVNPNVDIKTDTEDHGLVKLEKANAIRDILSKRILKSKGGSFDVLENEIRGFLNNKLDCIFSGDKKDSLSNDEVAILKIMCQRIKEKERK